MRALAILAAGVTALSFAAPAFAAPVITDATTLATTIITPTPPFGGLTEAVGSQTTGTGIDFTYGNVEGIFDDGGGVYGFCGINSAGACDLETAVDGSIVGLASFISAEAGFAGDGSLTLTVYDSAFNILASALNGPPLGPNGRTTFSITRPTSDIAYFSIAGVDSFGVNQITLDGLVGNGAVPEPSTWAMMLIGFGALGAAMRRKRRETLTVRYA